MVSEPRSRFLEEDPGAHDQRARSGGESFAALAEQDELKIDDLDDAVGEARAFIDAIARADLPGPERKV